MASDVSIDSGGEFMLEMAGAALCDGDTLGGVYDNALDLAVGALRYRAKRMREDADHADEGDFLHRPDKLRTWAADDEQAADRLQRLLEIGREQVRETEGLTEPARADRQQEGSDGD